MTERRLTAKKKRKTANKKTAARKRKKKTSRERSSPKQAGQDSPDEIRTQKQAADYCGVTVRTLRNWEKERVLRDANGCYVLELLDKLSAGKGEMETDDKRRAQKFEAELKRIKSEMLDMDLKVKRGELVPIDAIEAGRVARINEIKRGLLGLGRKLARRLAHLTDPREIQQAIDDECRNLIESYAR